jgi:prepilin-type N-terminal cleavage/methylation domain-containing protein
MCMSIRQPAKNPARRGMTLVELLVVIGILLLLLVTVIPILSPTADQKGREAAATVVSMIERSKARSQANDSYGAGLWLEPIVTSGSIRVVPLTPPTAVVQIDGANLAMGTLDLFACEPQFSYNGDDLETAKAYVYPVNQTPDFFVPSFPSNESLVLFEERSCDSIRQFCAQSSRVSIESVTYYFRLLSEAEQASLSVSYLPKPYRPCNLGPQGEIPPGDPRHTPEGNADYYSGYGPTLTPGDGGPAPELVIGWIRAISQPSISGQNVLRAYTPVNMNFPVSSAGVPFSIARPNTRSATAPLSLPAGYAVDVAWSSYGTTLLHNSADSLRLGNGPQMTLLPNFLANQPLQVMFDSSQALQGVVVKKFLSGFGVGDGAIIEDTLTGGGDIFLLVGRADRVGLPYVATPTEANPGANWQYPDSRWIKIAGATGKTLIADPFLGVNNVFDSQKYARADIAAVRN